MSVSFKDYVIISTAFADAQLDEGAVWDAIKKKLGGGAAKMTDDEIEAEVERLKGEKEKNLGAIKKTKAAREFEARRAAAAAASAAKKPQPTVSTHAGVQHAKSRLDATSSPNMRAAQSKAAERDWALGEETLTEGRQEYIVSYTMKYPLGNTKVRTAKIGGITAVQVRRKFTDTFYGAKILSVVPAKPAKKVEEGSSPLGPRTKLEESTTPVFVVAKVGFTYDKNGRDREGKATVVCECENAEKAKKMLDRAKSSDLDESLNEADDFMQHITQNLYGGQFVSGSAFVDSASIPIKAPNMDSRAVFAGSDVFK